MQKKGELSRLAVNLLIGSLIIILGVVIFFIVRGYINDNGQEVFTDENIDLKISQVKTVDDNTLGLTLNRGIGEGEFVGLSFAVSDGILTEVVRVNSSMPENKTGNFSLNFISLNASKIKKVSVTPIYLDEDGIEVIGNVKDEYVTPNTCSNYCPVGAQCGLNDCGMQCGNGCSKGYLCLNYKCIKQQTSSGGGGSGGGSGSGGSSGSETCTDTCASLVKQCGIQTICGSSVNCGTCQTGYVCSLGLCILEETCTDTCNSLMYNCGTYSICGVSTNCGTCSTGYTCQISNGTCMKDCSPITCAALARNCGTVSNGCGGTLNCGTCSSGFSCHTNGTCMKDVVITCNGITCKSGEYCSNGVCLLDVSGNTYFVATNGNDNNPGTFEQPWKTWKKAFTSTSVNAGDIVYFRGGVYYINGTSPQISASRTGTSSNWITYSNYPGETPILDFTYANWGDAESLNGLWFYTENCNYIKLIGLTVRNILQSTNAHEQLTFGIVFNNGFFTAERCTVYNVNGIGFYSYFYNGWPSVNGEHYFINCDAYNCSNPYAVPPALPGNYGVGFSAQNFMGNEGKSYAINCRAWNNGDQGFSWNGDQYCEIENCWAMDNGQLQGEGHGFKMGWNDRDYPSNALRHKYTNCIAAHNLASGFNTNEGDSVASRKYIYNSLAYGNGFDLPYGGFWISNTGDTNEKELLRTFINNLAYGNINEDLWVPISGALFTSNHNSWDVSGITINNNDFVSLNYSQLKQPRKANGSLPDITFGQLAQGSDLIDAGTIISGYHCSTSGAHPGENCQEWYGSAPDIGPFESNYASSCNGITCKSGEYCSNGACLLDVSGNTYFVALNGNDNNPGTFEQPWYSWQKAFDVANAGDIVYIRGGVWYPTVYVTHDPSSGHGHNGTSANPILFYNYPGEKPILDCINFTSTRDASGLDIREDTYIKFRGLTVRNVKEKVYDHWIAAIQTYNTGVIYLESMTSHDNGGHGFNFNTYNTLYITNCDSYNNADIISSEPGNRADGFSGGSGGSDTDLYKIAYYNGCRAWNNSDDGFDIGSSKQVRISNSWSFNNGYLPYGGGVGFKFGPSNIQDPNKRITYNTLAVNNNYDGYTYENLNDGLVGPVGAFYNNFAYKCNMGFTSDQGSFDCANGYTQSIHRNNAAYQSTYSSAYDQTYFSLCAYEGPYNASRFIQENNTWIHKIDWPFWEYNPAITVSDSDFVSLDYSQLSLPRKSDGSLPDITFAHLKQGSDLIDAGKFISSYHCSTSGAHSGENCQEWYGSAPDIGPFESNY